MPPLTPTTDLEQFTARVQKAATAHSVNENEFGNNIYKTLRITGMDLEDEDGPGQEAGKPKRKKAKVIVETVVRKGMMVVVLGSPRFKLVPWCFSEPGTKLKIISETLNVGGRIANMRCEIRNADNNKLIASGFHSKVNVTPKPTNKAVVAAKL
ncbi:hypothetical protein QFC22_003375 [Naganishia vaughanmartiniae]|uniref:Uncharacterized protein n=1 Tax=Naganishia vaughanmartiniae TaxID=1424756 RepID=A0ACC2X6H9_9TREE|nr:hypothetical protein QFC22_003375 [Naganishia vaughanmartiniae]